MRGKLLWYAFHPLGLLWLLAAVALAAGIGEWLFFDRSPWEGLGAAFTIAGLTKIVAHVKGIPAWPWDQPTSHPPPAVASRRTHVDARRYQDYHNQQH